MPKTALSVAMMLFSFLSTGTLLAQIRTPSPPARPVRPHVEPCWQQVGISKSAIDERAAIQRETRSQVEAVCADSGLAPQQKQQRIHEIRQQAKQRSEALVSPQQQEALSACQKERAGNRQPAPPAVHHGGGATGPCGELLPPAAHPAGPTEHPNTEKPPAENETPPQ